MCYAVNGIRISLIGMQLDFRILRIYPVAFQFRS